MVLANLFGQRNGGRRRSQGAGLPAGVMSNSYFGVTDGDAAFDTSAEVAAIIQANTTNTSFTKIWEHTVPAGQMIAWGHGSPNQQRNQGYIWFAALDVGTGFEDGVLQLKVANARETRNQFVSEYDTRALHTTTSTTMVTAQPLDINAKTPLPFTGLWVKEDSRMQLWFRSTIVTTTVDATDFSIPVTILQ